MQSVLLSLLFVGFLCGIHALDPNMLRVLGPQGVNLWKLQAARDSTIQGSKFTVQDGSELQDDTDLATGFQAQWFRQPLDHFSKNSSETFLQRYWVNSRHYKPGVGGPVILLDGGETSGVDRLPFLDTGIVEILARATGGVGVVLEHRYYGRSIAVKNLTTDSLRFLNNAQSAADSANFMANVMFADIDEDLTAPKTPWIYYGGSYAGARAAHMKILYPDLVYGAIASSAVTHAAIVNWEYMDIIRQAADPRCSSHLVNSIKTIDTILDQHTFARTLKRLFGLADLSDEDFASVIESPLGAWQAKCWDPKYGSNAFDGFCESLDKPVPGTAKFVSKFLSDLPYGHPQRMVSLQGGMSLDLAVLNYAEYIRENVVSQCPEESTVNECFGTYKDEQYQETTLDQTWRLWLFQVCTEWGYFSIAPPDSNTPRIVSKRLTLAYESKICKQAFPPGKHFIVPKLPNITSVNSLGDFDIADDRLAIIDGEVDPWRAQTPHSQYYAKDREDTLLRPFKIIPNGVHHYDEWGLADLSTEPPEIREVHGEMIAFVMEWLKDWEAPKQS